MNKSSFSLNTEYPEENEELLIQKLIDEFILLYQEENHPDKKPAPRGTHPKTIACARGEFIIEPNLSPDLRVGLFQESKTFPVWVRFSQTRVYEDNKRDNRSLSIKVMDVPGKKILPEAQWSHTQDFLMRSTPIFYIRNVRDFLELLQKRKTPLKFFFPSFHPKSWRLRELYLIVSQLKRFSNLLEIPYWGEVPYCFGTRTMKYAVKPQPGNVWKHKISPSSNFLNEVMAQFLQNKEAYFDFQIQFQTDPMKMPIEDATVEWDSRLSPFYKVATLKIHSQDINAQENKEQGENLSFNPWHALPEHKPLGGLNRARRHLYQIISTLRHERNHMEEKEP